MRTRVKFCGLVRPEDVDAAVAIGADAIGFVFFSRSPRFIDVETARMLRRRLPSYVCAVGLFVNDKLVAYGEVVVVEDNFGIKITELVGSAKQT